MNKLQTVEVTYQLGDNTENDLVEINKPHTELSKINVFDSGSVLPLINSDLTFSILPKGFEKFQMVSGLLDSLRNEVSAMIEVEKEKQERLFSDSSFDFIREELRRIIEEAKNSKDIKGFLDSNYPRSESYEEVIKEIDIQIKELDSTNPKDKITILTAQKAKLTSIKESFIKLSKMLSRENIDKVNTLIKDYEQKIQEEREYNETFQKKVSYLKEVNDEWFTFIKMGKRYYESIKQEHLIEGDSCIFCSQSLDLGSIDVIESNFNHIAKSNVGLLNSIEKELIKYSTESIVVNFSDEESALFENEMFLERVKSAIQLVNRNKDLFSSLLKSKQNISEQVILDVTDVVEEINMGIDDLQDRITNLKKTSTEAGEIIASRKALKETLKKNEKLHSSLELLVEWFELEKLIKEYSKAKGKFSTNSLTQKQSEAFQEIVQGEYYEIFNRYAQELKVSNVNLKLIGSSP